MVREELEESSSSQNDKLIITAIQRGVRKKDTCLFSDGSSFLLPPGFMKEHSLVPGMALSIREALLLRKKAQILSVKQKGLELLSRREHTYLQLKNKLILKGFDKEIISEVLDDLKAEGSLDEVRFCRVWLRSRLKKHPEWRPLLLAGLMKAGVKRSMAEEIVTEVLMGEDQGSLIELAAEKINRGNRLKDEKLIKKLISRGFSYKQVIQYIKSLH